MNHKRKRPKSQRAGCLLCKGHKAECNKQRDRAHEILGQETADWQPLDEFIAEKHIGQTIVEFIAEERERDPEFAAEMDRLASEDD